MNKTNNTHLFRNVCILIIIGILIALKVRRRHHKGVGESAGKSIDDLLMALAAALDKAIQFVHHALNRIS